MRPLGASEGVALLERDGALLFFMQCITGTASPVLTHEEEFPGKYALCPCWGSKEKDQTVFVDAAYAH